MNPLPKTETLVLDPGNGWLTIWFNTPQNRNALSDRLTKELSETLHAIRDHKTVRGVTLRGKGGVFCAGGDLKSFNAAIAGGVTHKDAAAMNRFAGELFDLLNTMPQVVVALVEGAAIAGGLGMACCADVIVVTKDAKFALTETQIGIPPAQITPYIVQRVGLTTARRLMLCGVRFNGAEALEMGFADFVVDDANGLDRAEAEIRKGVKRCAPGANAITKEILFATRELKAAAMIEFAADGFARAFTGDEGREGVASFVEKRKPNWAE